MHAYIRTPALVLLFVLASVAAPVQGQDLEAAAVSVSDPAGDVASTIPYTPAFDFVDLVDAAISTTEQELTVSMAVVSLSADWTRMQEAEYWWEFEFRGEVFHVNIAYSGSIDTEGNPPTEPVDPTKIEVYRLDGEKWTRLLRTEAEGIEDENRVQGTVPLTVIATSDGVYPLPSDRLHVRGVHAFWDDSNLAAHDGDTSTVAVMEDDAPTEEGTELVVPGSSATSIILSARNPVRFSNGEATTFHWRIETTSLLPDDTVADVGVDGPGDVEVRHPTQLALPVNESRFFDVFATVPFNHEHGGERIFAVQVAAGGETAELELTIRYLATPQPAGHHDTLYLHGGTPSSTGVTSNVWINTRMPEDSALLGGQAGECQYPGNTRGGTSWQFPLNPPLAIGLDGRIDELASLDVTATVQEPVPDGSLYAVLQITDANSRPPLPAIAINDTTAEARIEGQTMANEMDLHFDIPLPASMDYMMPDPDQNLALHLMFCPDNVPEGVDYDSGTLYSYYTSFLTPRPPLVLNTGGQLDLPLDEFRDPLQLEDAGNLEAWLVDEPVLRVPQGGTAAWYAEINVTGIEPTLFGLSIDHAQIHDIQERQGTTRALVSLEIPQDSPEGTVHEVILAAETGDEQADPAIRLAAIVAQDGQDYSMLLEGHADSEPTPIMPIWVSLMFLGAVLVLHRRAAGRE